MHLAALGDVVVERLDLRLEEVGCRAGNRDDGGVGGDGFLLNQHELLDGEVVLLHLFDRRAEPAAIGRGDVLLAVALGEIHLPGGAGDDLDQRVGEVLFIRGGHALGAALVFEQDRRQRLDLCRAGARRLAVGIDVLRRQPGRLILILLQSILVEVLAIVALEDGDPHRFLELLQDPDGLIRQAVNLVRGQIPALALARAEVIDRDEDREEHDHADDRHGAVSGAAALVEGGDVAPLTRDVDEDAGKTGPRRVSRVLIPGRVDRRDAEKRNAANQQRAENEDGSNPADDAQDFLHD